MGDRAVDCARLESVCAQKAPGVRIPAHPLRGRSVRRARRILVALIALATLTGVIRNGAAEESKPPTTGRLAAAQSDYQRGDFQHALSGLETLEKEKGAGAESLNLRGAILLEQDKLAPAREAFTAALQREPSAFGPRLHLAEILFREKKYAEARGAYEELYREAKLPVLLELLRYDILLTYLAEKNDWDARHTLERISFPGETPAYYYAHAAVEFAAGHRDDAKKWLAGGEQIFDSEPSRRAPFLRPLYDLGWIKDKPKIPPPP